MSLYIADLLRIILWFLPLYCVGRMVWLRTGRREKNPVRELVLAVFVLFMFGLLNLTFQNGLEALRASSPMHAWIRWKQRLGVNLIPFHTIKNYLKYGASADAIWVNIAGNIVMFVPWGFGLPLLWRRYQSFFKVAWMSLCLPIFIEFCQLFIGRSVDIDDIILNFTGGILGGLLYWLARKLFPRLERLACENESKYGRGYDKKYDKEYDKEYDRQTGS